MTMPEYDDVFNHTILSNVVNNLVIIRDSEHHEPIPAEELRDVINTVRKWQAMLSARIVVST